MMCVCKMRPLCSPALCKQLDPSIYLFEIIVSVINSPLTKQFMVNSRLTSCKLAVIELHVSSITSKCPLLAAVGRGRGGGWGWGGVPFWNVISADEVNN